MLYSHSLPRVLICAALKLEGHFFFFHCCGDGEFLDLVRILLHKFHTEYSIVVEIHWLSWGQILSPLVELWTEVTIVLREKRKNLQIWRFRFILSLTYLAEIFPSLINLYCSIQRSDVTNMDAGKNLKAFLEKVVG